MSSAAASKATCSTARSATSQQREGPSTRSSSRTRRYNAELSTEGLTLLGLPDINPADVQRLDSIEHIAELQQVGRAVATRVKREHFAGFPV